MATRTLEDVLPPRYTSVELLARGGMGEIYEACDDGARADGRGQGARRGLRARPGAARALHARGARGGAAFERRPHGHDLRRRRVERAALHRDGARARRHRRRPPRQPRRRRRARRCAGWSRPAPRSTRHTRAASFTATSSRRTSCSPSDGDIRVADFGIASAAGLTSMTETGTRARHARLPRARAGRGRDRRARLPTATRSPSSRTSCWPGRRPFEHDTGASEALAAGREPVPPISQLRPRPAGAARRDLRARAREGAGQPPRLVRRARRRAAPRVCRRRRADSRRGRQRVAPRRRAAAWLPWALALVLLAGAGVAAAVLLTRGDDGGRRPAARVVRTITAQGKTVTVTAATPTTAAQTPAPTPAPSSGASGSSLNDSGYSRMQARRLPRRAAAARAGRRAGCAGRDRSARRTRATTSRSRASRSAAATACWRCSTARSPCRATAARSTRCAAGRRRGAEALADVDERRP